MIKNWVDEEASISLNSLKNKIYETYGIEISKSTVARILNDFHYTLKRLHLIPERRNNENVLEERRQYAFSFTFLPASFSEEEMIFIDEVGFNVTLRTTRRSLVGTPATQIVPSIRSRNISVICALNIYGIVHYTYSHRAINKDLFIEFINELKNKLTEKNIIKSVMIMDNVRFHKSDDVQNCINDGIHRVLYLPPYSPFLNPIENMFSKWKEIIKRGNPRNENELFNLIQNGAQLVSSNDCVSYIRHMWTYVPRCLNGEIINN